jgi:hypothetical protein
MAQCLARRGEARQVRWWMEFQVMVGKRVVAPVTFFLGKRRRRRESEWAQAQQSAPPSDVAASGVRPPSEVAWDSSRVGFGECLMQCLLSCL